MKKILNIILILGLLSCNRESTYWHSIIKSPKFITVFKFAYQNRESTYLDSAIAIMKDTLSLTKDLRLKYHDDTIELINPNLIVRDKIAKSSVIFYDAIQNELIYKDSIYKAQNLIDSTISVFIQKVNGGELYIFTDTLTNKNDWITLFSKIDRIASTYQLSREKYSEINFGKGFIKLSKSPKNEILKRIPMNILIYFNHPFPPPAENLDLPIYIIPDVN